MNLQDNMSREEFIKLVTKMVMEVLDFTEPSIPIGVSNRHIHLCREDMDVLFGFDSQLTPMKDLRQPGQYACEETVTIKGPKGQIGRVRILGPLRAETQVEISVTDGFTLGVHPPVKESGKLENTPGIEIIGPKGSVKKQSGTIAALRHIHMSPADANKLGVKDEDYVCVNVGSDLRSATLHNVLVRVSDKFVPEMHLDVDEANAVGVKNGDYATICK